MSSCTIFIHVSLILEYQVWQAFVGVRARRVETYFQDSLALGSRSGNNNSVESEDYGSSVDACMDSVYIPEKWRGQIEKDLPWTFPGHLALDEDGRSVLRRLLNAYARHNPSVGYCQVIQFDVRNFLLWNISIR